jgi:NAD(P)-dependent dehydrogenase (short-subunit alcohol dehydrogenase family)
MTLAGRVALVTGGTGGLGQAVTLRLLAEGARVCAPYIVEAERAALLGRVASARDRLELIEADVTDTGAMTALAGDLATRHGRIDALVSLVGGFAGGSLVETDRATWDRQLELNATSAFTAARAVVPIMQRAGRGRIVTIGSRAVLPPGPGFIAYTVSKAAVIAFSQALAQELRGSGVTVNCVLPSTMDTPGNRASMPDADRKGWVPVEGVADAIAYLVGDSAAHVTGSLVTV